MPPGKRRRYLARAVGLGLLVAGMAVMISFSAVAQAAPQASSRPRPCAVAFPGAHDKTIGRTTWYNRQSSVENVVCFGFGLNPSADFPITAGMVCGLVSQAIGVTADTLALFVDGACSGAALAADPREPAQYIETACSWVSDLLEKLAKPIGIAASIGCTFAPSVGHSLGGALESVHELEVAADIIARDKCLKYSPTHFGSPWLAVACASGDRGFSTLAPHVSPTTASCSPAALFQAAVAKEHFNPRDPSYANFGANGNNPGAYDVICSDGWAAAYISRPNVGVTDGATVFRLYGGAWHEVAQLGAAIVECNLEQAGVPNDVAVILGRGTPGSSLAGCDAPDAFASAKALWKTAVCDPAAQQPTVWDQVASQLELAQPAYAGQPQQYKAAIAQLKSLASLPNTDFTNAQGTQTIRDKTALDTFFGTPGLYLTYFGSCS